MIIIVCGGRDFRDRERAFWALDYWHARLSISLLVQGGQVSTDPAERGLPWEARRKWGADYFAKCWALDRGVASAEEAVADADWKKFGLAAGPLRNTRMLMKHRPERVLGFPGGSGTADMLAQAHRAGIKCIEVSPA